MRNRIIDLKAKIKVLEHDKKRCLNAMQDNITEYKNIETSHLEYRNTMLVVAVKEHSAKLQDISREDAAKLLK